ncbi:restriction endonuclease subunit S [Lactobacillus mulieris]|uniref:restriction endonuclease subunit S n=1 Tax=Lactobacillus mulieris TaxID=2508708 RepID=UPI0022ABCCDC|nr:restriction endonuclease subunit S [Lactobacillus mulieris]MCZ3740824.1 restriction endonuclease subunit S [Lactobacillus mulieris]MCZ3747662.1 restriction endonuclease subunit S [Lactobacillus mulieris]MCZ3749546.1 restriction endonuclease subunit S [Lactobacillus mulieris]MDT9629056.1 restriction endonuclease subunit S [Lactobacillus mulieris]
MYPKVRFRGFDASQEFKNCLLSEVARNLDNKRIPITANKRKKGKIPYFGSNGIQDYVKGYTHNGTFILIAEDGANNLKHYPVIKATGKIWVNNHAHVLQALDKKIDFNYLYFLLFKYNFEKYLVGSGRYKLNAAVLEKLPIKICNSKNEQIAIGKILASIDNLLSLQQRKLELEKALEKSLFQNLYTDFPNIFPKLAFEKSPWHAIKLQDAFTEISKRSKAGQLLTVSISKGIFPFNESERKNNSSSDKSKYKVVKINDIAYNTMRMWQGAEAVSRYDGIVSPAYTVIRAKKNQNPFFYAFMFKREKYLYLFQTYSQGLTSDTWNLKYPLFKEIKAMIPENLYIQDKIANILNTRLKHTELENTKLETFQALKQFLLQNLFI